MRREVIKKIVIYCIVGVLIYLASNYIYFTFLQKAELQVQDFKQKISLVPEDGRIVIIEVTDDSIDQIGRWPWPRTWHGALVTILKKYGAKAIVFDVIFGEEENEQYDKAFADAIKKAGNVYLPVIFECENVLDNPVPFKYYSNIPVLQQSAYATGHIVAIPDLDGVIRRIPIHLEYEGKRYPSLSYRVARDIVDEKVLEKIPVTSKGSVVLRWTGPWEKTFKHFSFADVIKSYAQIAKGEKPIIDLTIFKDKICFIGLTASALGDIKSSPIHHSFPGVGYHANLLNMILVQKYVKQLPDFAEQIVLIILIIISLIIIRQAEPLRALFAIFGIISIYGSFNIILFKWFDLNINFIQPISAMIWSYITVDGYTQYVLMRERRRLFKIATTDGLTQVYNVRYFREVMNSLTQATCDRNLRYFCDKPFSLIICDIDKFKSFNDTYGHQVGDAVLKHFAAVLSQSVRGLDMVARYGGEEFVIVLFDTPIESGFKIADKVRAAVENSVVKHEGKEYKVTASFGVSEFRKGEDDLERLIKRADDGLYEAKESGRNRVCSKDIK